MLLARDGEGGSEGVLHFVPCYGRPAVSLSFMRRDPDTPNGLTEFMVATAAELLRERGLAGAVAELRHVRPLDAQPVALARASAWAAGRAGQPVLPDREPVPVQRQVLPSLGAALPRLRGRVRAAAGSLAAEWAEGQLPKPRRRGWRTARSRSRRCAAPPLGSAPDRRTRGRAGPVRLPSSLHTPLPGLNDASHMTDASTAPARTSREVGVLVPAPSVGQPPSAARRLVGAPVRVCSWRIPGRLICGDLRCR